VTRREARRQADQGKLRGMHSSVGQEAVPTGICAHLKGDDYVLGVWRGEQGVEYVRMYALEK